MKTPKNRLSGTIAITAKGTGYVTPLGTIGKKNKDEDIEVDFKHLHTALHGDTVEISLLPKTSKRIQGEVVEVLIRAKTNFAGVLENEGA